MVEVLDKRPINFPVVVEFSKPIFHIDTITRLRKTILVRVLELKDSEAWTSMLFCRNCPKCDYFVKKKQALITLDRVEGLIEERGWSYPANTVGLCVIFPDKRPRIIAFEKNQIYACDILRRIRLIIKARLI